MELKIATDIKTETFYSIIKFLVKNGWQIFAEYDDRIFDKGIDFDFYQLNKDEEKILLVISTFELVTVVDGKVFELKAALETL